MHIPKELKFASRLGCTLLTCLAVAGCGSADSIQDVAGNQNVAVDGPAVATDTEAATTCPTGQYYFCPPPTPDVKHPPCGCFIADQHYTIEPTYLIASVFYAPPGTSSSINYSTDTTLGTTTSATHGFKQDTKVTTSASWDFKFDGNSVGAGLDLSMGTTFNNTFTDSVDVAETWTNGFKVNGQTTNIDHNYDQILLVIDPIVNVTVYGAGGVQWAFAPPTPTTYIQQIIYAGWLNGSMAMPANVKATLDYYKIPQSEYIKILAADPLFPGVPPNQVMDPNRFDYISDFSYVPLYAPGNTPSMTTYAVKQSDNSSHMVTSEIDYSVSFTETAGGTLGPLTAKLSSANTWTWTDASSQKDSSGKQTTDTLVIGQPPADYTGPTMVHVYEDRIYKTYAFTVDYPQGYPTDLALGRPATESTTYPGGEASRATDGNTNGDFYAGSVALTQNGWMYGTVGWPGQFWFVDLGAEHVINSVNIANRTDCCSGMLSHYNILAWDSMTNDWMVVSDHSQDDTTGELFLTHQLNAVKTQYVMVGKTDDDYLSLAEVQVMGW